MPRRRSKRPITRVLKDLLRNLIAWRTTIVTMWAFSVILIANILWCTMRPCTYPTSNLEDIVRVRSLENQPPVPSSVTFVDVPINTKQRIVADLDSLVEIDVKHIEEMYLTEYGGLTYTNFSFLSLEEISSLEVFFDGSSMEYYCFENDGQRYYSIEDFTVMGKEEIYKLEILYTIRPRVYSKKFINIPWIFNDNYARVVDLPVTNIAVQIGEASDLCTLRVNLDVPFRTILKEQSGWRDRFVCPRYEWGERSYVETTFVWTETGPQPVVRVLPSTPFHYPIEQEFENEKNLYVFSTHFSEENQACDISLTLVPSSEMWIIPLIFLSSPFYAFVLIHIDPRRRKTRESQKGKYNLQGLALDIIKVYSGPILSLVYFIIAGVSTLSIFSFMYEITNPYFFWVMLLYPTLFLIFDFFRSKQKQVTSHSG